MMSEERKAISGKRQAVTEGAGGLFILKASDQTVQHLVHFLNTLNPLFVTVKVSKFGCNYDESFGLLTGAETYEKKLDELFIRESAVTFCNVGRNRKRSSLELGSNGISLRIWECVRCFVQISSKIFRLLPNYQFSKASFSHNWSRGYHMMLAACRLPLVAQHSILPTLN